jgi:hypothetical protein
MSIVDIGDTGKGKPKYLEKYPCQCHFVHHKSYVGWLEIEPGHLW